MTIAPSTIWLAAASAADGDLGLYREAMSQIKVDMLPLDAWVSASQLLRRYGLDPIMVFLGAGLIPPPGHPE